MEIIWFYWALVYKKFEEQQLSNLQIFWKVKKVFTLWLALCTNTIIFLTEYKHNIEPRWQFYLSLDNRPNFNCQNNQSQRSTSKKIHQLWFFSHLLINFNLKRFNLKMQTSDDLFIQDFKNHSNRWKVLIKNVQITNQYSTL